MKNRLLAFSALILLAISAQPAHSASEEFMDFILGYAHEVGHTNCDAAIKAAFSVVAGERLRVMNYGPPDNNKVFKLTAGFGFQGDTVYMEGGFLDRGDSCYYALTTIVSAQSSCSSYLEEYPEFSLLDDVGGMLFARTILGADMILKPNGENHCTAIYNTEGIK